MSSINNNYPFSNFYKNIPTLLRPGDRLLIAFSGGLDSSVLLHLCSKLRPMIDIHAVHINHGLRKESREEQGLVKKTCSDLKVPLSIETPHLFCSKNESIEMWARRIRYDAYSAIQKTAKCNLVATAHHADDNAETLLMHLDDGCSINGISGIPYRNKLIIRPLLRFKRIDIETYARINNVNFVNDSSNEDLTIKRNYVRKSILEPWKAQGRNLVNRFTDISIKAEEAITRMNSVINTFSKKIKKSNGRYIIDDCLIHNLSNDQFIRVVKNLIQEANISWRYFKWMSFGEWISSSKTGSFYKISDSWTILRDRSKWILESKNYNRYRINIEKFGQLTIDQKVLSIKKIDKKEMSRNVKSEIIDAEFIEG